MKAKLLSVRIRFRAFACWRALPIFGPLLDDFVEWMAGQRYALRTIGRYLKALPKVVRWLRRHRITALDQLTQQHLQVGHDYYRPKHEGASWLIGALERFLSERHLVPEGDPPTPSPVEVEVDRFAIYLREVRGLSETTISSHSGRLRAFLHFLRFDGKATPLRRLDPRQIEAFLRKSARTNDRFSMQHIVATVRSYLKEAARAGGVPRPLHLQIDTPRVYRGERLPRALAWDQVQALIQSIDRSEPFGRRDFTLLYLAAAYGLRSGELVRLTLDDIDWRGGTLLVRQTKTRQTLRLPLTDEAANVLIDYLRKACPRSTLRQLFLRTKAPFMPLQPTAVSHALERRLRCSGLNLPPFGTHVLRHSFATRLMRQGVSIKAIGDALGHRDIESTSTYLRLNVDDLQTVALPAPATPPGKPAKLIPLDRMPRIRPSRPSHNLPARFCSRFASSLQRFVALKQTLGRIYRSETAALRHWDDFICRRYPRAGMVRAEMFTEWTKHWSACPPPGAVSFTEPCGTFFYSMLGIMSAPHSRPADLPKPAPVVTPRLSRKRRWAACGGPRQLPPWADNPLRAETFYIGFLLLFCCGLRRGELLRLKSGDIQEEQTLLHIRRLKIPQVAVGATLRR